MAVFGDASLASPPMTVMERSLEPWGIALCLLCFVLGVTSTAEAQSFVGKWTLDVNRSALTKSLEEFRPTIHQELTVSLDGLTVRLDVITTGILFINSLGLATDPGCCRVPPPRPGSPAALHPDPVVQHLSYQLDGSVSQFPYGDLVGMKGSRVGRALPDFTGFDVAETWGEGVRSRMTTYRTTPDSDTLTIEITQGDERMVRVFMRQR